MTSLTFAHLPARLRRRLAEERAQRKLERDVSRLMSTAGAAYSRRSQSGTGPRIGVATFGSGNWHLTLELLLAHALALRGASPELLVCDIPALPVCDERTNLLRDPARCPGCVSAKRPLLDLGQVPWRGVSGFAAPGALERAARVVAGLRDEELEPYAVGRWPIGRWVYVSMCHYLHRDARGNDPQAVAARRLFLTSAIVVLEAVERWLEERQPEVVIAESGAHFMWRIVFELARAGGCRVVCREIGKGGFDSHIYSVNAECMFPAWNDLWAAMRPLALSHGQAAQVEAYLQHLPSRTYAPPDEVIPPRSAAELRETLALTTDRRTVVLFTNVTWDLATAGRDAGFDGMFDWLGETLRLAERFPDVQFVIRVHPAERHVPISERALEWMAAHGPLPNNVRTIAPETRVSTRDLCAMANLVLAYCSTAGIEAAIYGQSVMLAGAPHYRGKGFTIDIESRAHYLEALTEWASGALACPPGASEVATRYFHLFFLRYHIDMGWTTSPLEPPFSLTISELSELLPGRNRSVDVVCAGVLEGKEIVSGHDAP